MTNLIVRINRIYNTSTAIFTYKHKKPVLGVWGEILTYSYLFLHVKIFYGWIGIS